MSIMEIFTYQQIMQISAVWKKMYQLIAVCLLFIALRPIYLPSSIFVGASTNCPNGCECDDDTLIVKCGEGSLDVLPITLNPSIQRLIIKNNKIRTIDSSIQFYAELTFLDLSNNELIIIPQKTFTYQRKLQELHLNQNKIGDINNSTFLGLISLVVLNLRGNLIAEIEHRAFTSTAKIEELNLGQNRISHIDAYAFVDLINLRVLYLDDNTLTIVPDTLTFQTIPSLAELFLGTNSFTTIQSKAFQDLKGLTLLDLRGAGLNNISAEALIGLKNLRSLDLSDNRLEIFPTAALTHLERLEKLYLGQNDFQTIPLNALIGLKNLRHFEVVGAQRLQTIENGAFESNTNLEVLNLSSNKLLHTLGETSLSGLPHLRKIILKDNQFKRFAERSFSWDKLQTLDISDNPLTCDCDLRWLQNLLISSNTTKQNIVNVVCLNPEHLRSKSLQQISPYLLGCSKDDGRSQAMVAVLLVVVTASVTILALILYGFRQKIRKWIRKKWGNTTIGHKEREYQKTFPDDDCASRQHHRCNLGAQVRPSYQSGTFSPHPNQCVGLHPIPVTEL